MNPEVAGVALKMVMALGATLLVFAGVIVIMKKFQTEGGLKALAGKKGAAKRKPIEVIHNAVLGPGRSLHVIRCHGKTLLVGSTNQGVALISELDDELDSDSDFGSTLVENLREKSASSLKRQVQESLENISRV